LTLVALLTAPTAAEATNVDKTQSGTRAVFIVDIDGVTDNLEVTGSTGGVTVTSRNGTAITDGVGCDQTSPTVVTCPGATDFLQGVLGPRDDSLIDRTNLPFAVDGGTGNDSLQAGVGSGTLIGGEGADRLFNGAFPDSGPARTVESVGGIGNDQFDLSSNAAGADIARGGEGRDRVFYSQRSTGVTVTLNDVANDGGPQEGDDVRSDVEDLTGTTAPDSLTGSNLPNTLDAGSGADGVFGLGGDDRLNGGPQNDNLVGGTEADILLGGGGNDVQSGGEGNDRLGSTQASADLGQDTLRGGNGFDQLLAADGPQTPGGASDLVIDCGPPTTATATQRDEAVIDLADPQPTGCDSVQQAAKDQHPTVQVSAGRVRVLRGRAALRLRCPRRAPGGRCAGRLSIVKRGRTLATARYRLRAGRSRTVRVRLRRFARGRARVRTRERDTTGRPETTLTPIRLA
jgi:Ca2+-binding RTX toxin-like protein